MEFVFAGFGLVLIILFFTIIGVLINVLLGFCVYYDALYYNDPNAVMWGVLSGFFQIAALVYLILRINKKKSPMRCMQCGSYVMPGTAFCTHCGRPLNVPSSDQLALYDRRRRKCFWGWIIAMGSVFVLSFLFGIGYAIVMIAAGA